MTPREFKAWFDGFTEAMSGTPTKAQWARIKERVGEIDGKAVTEQVFVNRYWPSQWSYTYWNGPSYTTCGTVNLAANALQGNAANHTTGVFYSNTAMQALGHADAKLLNVS